MDYIIAFVIIFAGVNLGSGEGIRTKDLALDACRKVYPNGIVSLYNPVTVTLPSEYSFTASFVWICLRPKTDTDYQTKGEESQDGP